MKRHNPYIRIEDVPPKKQKIEDNEPIYFYDAKEKPYGVFSNFYIAPKKEGMVLIEGKKYLSTEHYYQCKKFDYPGANKFSLEYSNLIRNAKTPNLAFCLANQVCNSPYPWAIKVRESIKLYEEKGVQIDENWIENRDSVMCKAVLEKFKQNERLKQILLNTKNRELIEHTSRDDYWADGGDGSGENKLGKTLMKVREILEKKVIIIA